MDSTGYKAVMRQSRATNSLKTELMLRLTCPDGEVTACRSENTKKIQCSKKIGTRLTAGVIMDRINSPDFDATCALCRDDLHEEGAEIQTNRNRKCVAAFPCGHMFHWGCADQMKNHFFNAVIDDIFFEVDTDRNGLEIRSARRDSGERSPSCFSCPLCRKPTCAVHIMSVDKKYIALKVEQHRIKKQLKEVENKIDEAESSVKRKVALKRSKCLMPSAPKKRRLEPGQSREHRMMMHDQDLLDLEELVSTSIPPPPLVDSVFDSVVDLTA